MYYSNNIPYYSNYMHNRSINQRYNNRFGGFVFPFALGFLSAPLLLKPNYYQGYNPNYYPYYQNNYYPKYYY